MKNGGSFHSFFVCLPEGFSGLQLLVFSGKHGMFGSGQGHGDILRAVSWSPCGRKVLTGGDDKTARIWKARQQCPPGNHLNLG